MMFLLGNYCRWIYRMKLEQIGIGDYVRVTRNPEMIGSRLQMLAPNLGSVYQVESLNWELLRENPYRPHIKLKGLYYLVYADELQRAVKPGEQKPVIWNSEDEYASWENFLVKKSTDDASKLMVKP